MDEALLKRVKPNSVDAEKSVLGAMLLDSEACMTASESLTSDDFYNKAYGMLFDVIVELYNEGKPFDRVVLVDKLKEKDTVIDFSNTDIIGELLASMPTSANIKNYIEIVKEKAVRRQLIKVTEDISNECYAGKEKIENLLDDTEQKVFKLLQGQGSNDFTPISRVAMNTLKKIEDAAKSKNGITGLSTGFIDLDTRTAGLQNSDLILIAARPSMGKTAFVLNLAQNIAIEGGTPALIFSLEMPKEQLMMRLFAQEGRIDAQKLRTGDLSEQNWEDLINAASKIAESGLVIDDTSGITVAEMRSKCRKYKLEHNIGVIIIDYLQLMSGSKSSESRQQEVAEISRSLKGIARELNVPVIALSQLSRAVEQRQDHRPMLSDLRESGSIEQDADVVMFLYREEYYNPETADKGVTEVIISKQRNGPTGTIKLYWSGKVMKFFNFEDNKNEQ